MNIRKFFTGGDKVSCGRESFEQFFEKKNAAIEALLRDFPWIWAINSHPTGHDSEYMRVSQELADLRVVLGQSSQDTRFDVWAITTQACSVFNMEARCLERSENEVWAEAVMRQTKFMDSILYLVAVDPLWGKNHPTRRLIIFRHPGKKSFNELVEEDCQLRGSNARWQATPPI
ncbi:MAG: hypothetical protein KBD24_02245 [Candidatus Pacebacteria bacterium]|nr:hypothetical protein [Candidatus Paceibacterota bacterium]